MAPSATFNRPLALLVAATSFMEFLDGTIIQTAAPAMAREFGVTAADLNVAMTVYLLALAVCIPATGWLADRFGTRRVYLAAIGVFTAASVLCALAPDLLWLCVFRAVQGVGGAMMVPVGRLAVLRAVEKTDLLDAMAYLTWPALLAPVIAPAVGGLITDTVGWRWIFLINLPIGIAAALAALALVPRTDELRRAPLDGYGLVLIAVALAALVLAGELVGETPTDWLAVAAGLLVAAVIGWLAWRRLVTARHPVLDLRALALDTFRVGNVGGGVYRLMITAVPFLVTLLFQAGFGWSAARAGLVVIALFVGNLGIKPATTPLIKRFGFRTVIVWSNAIGAAILLLLVLVDADTPIVLTVILLVASGAIRSIGFSGYNTIQFVDVPAELTNGANTLSSTMQQIATGLGIAVAALLVRLGTALAAETVGQPWLGYRWAFVGAAALLLIPLLEALHLPAHAGAVAHRPGR
ncbi:MFS transporter [Gryllotalpicola ginsengisoli]|uniref:MFS transporter n=1 Tax=Gryllotalpicola ginsengisoli TaxID=444608 RepID=UPI0003B3AAAE|nr:MFS transporter [Gryllotalpicola ginsengisoli]